MFLFHDLVVLFHTFLEQQSDWNQKKWHITAKTAGSPCLCHLKHLLSILSGAQQALTHSLFLTTNKTMWRIWEAQIVSSFVSSCFNHLNGSHHRSHKAPNCSIIKFSQFNTMFVYYLFMFISYIHGTIIYVFRRVSQDISALKVRCFVGVRSRSAQKVPPGPKAKHFAAPLHGRKGWKVGRLEGEAVTWHLWNGPSSVQSSGSGWVRLLKDRTSLEVKTSSFFSLILRNGMQNWKLATWPCQVGHIGITTRISSSAALNLRHTSSSAKDGPAALSSWESQVMF